MQRQVHVNFCNHSEHAAMLILKQKVAGVKRVSIDPPWRLRHERQTFLGSSTFRGSRSL